ncbi:MAG: hypothetical protein INR70_40950 [Parafilimonas terrae]|nr:hypothetical protein [Parafilimonas terrae]
MAAVRNGPARGQDIAVLQGAALDFVVPVRDPDPAADAPDLTGATAAWWVGPVPVATPRGQPCSVADAPDAFTKALSIVSDGKGGFQVLLPIQPTDYAGLVSAGQLQHKISITEVGKDPYPATLGRFVIQGTVKGAAG